MRGNRQSAAALIALALIALLCALTTGALAADGDGSDQVEIQVSECGDDTTATNDCGGATQIIDATPGPARSESTIKTPGSGTAAPASGSREVQRYSLKTGKGTVVTDDGETQASAIDVDEAVRRLAERPDAPASAPAPTLPQVQTDAGSPFAGFGSGFQFVSGDEALARFAIPPFLQPIYQAAGRAYGVPWNVLAAINSIETDFGRLENQVSSAGALGWMQFMPATWRRYGVDASGDGVADPWNPVDAIYAAARYLKAAGAANDLRGAVLAYNHADWYADSVLKTAGVYGSLPGGLVAESGSLAFGRFPLSGPVSYGDDFRRAQAAGRHPDGLRIEGDDGATAIATQDVTVKQILLSRPLAAALARRGTLRTRGLTTVKPAPLEPADDTGLIGAIAVAVRTISADRAPRARAAAPAVSHGLPRGYGRTRAPGLTVVVSDALDNTYRYEGLESLRPGLRPGLKLAGGKPIGHVGSGAQSAMVFAVRAAGGAVIDPRPLVDGYRLQEAAGFQHVAKTLGANPFVPSAGLVAAGTVSGTDRVLARRVLNDPGISIYECGRQDIARGDIDKRVLGALLYLRKAGLTLTITSLHCGHSFLTAGGNVSAHSYGAAVDIAAFNGQPVLGHQGPGSLTEQAIKLLMRLQGSAAPSQLISLMNLGGPSFALADHDDHLHVGYSFQPSLGLGRTGEALGTVVFGGGLVDGVSSLSGQKATRTQETTLSSKLAGIRNPKVRRDHGAGSVRIEGESADEAVRAQRLAAKTSPLRAIATAAGAEIADADVGGDTALAIGTVAGAGHAGWAREQTVVLARQAGRWTILGPPRDASGRVVNPKLRAIAALAGGRGYAVGDRGAIVLVRRHGTPLSLAPVVKADLSAVDAGGGVAYAAGEHGRIVRLAGRHAAAERAGDQSLRALTIRTDGTPVAMSTSSVGGPVLYRRDGGSWHGTAADFSLPDGAAVTITALADDAGALWAVGGISDSAVTGEGTTAPFAAQLAGGHWTTWCAGSPALTAVRELGSPTPRTCNSTLAIDPSTLGAAGDVAATSQGVVVSTPAGLELHGEHGFRPVSDLDGAGASPVAYSDVALGPDGSGWAVGARGAMAQVVRASAAPSSARLDRLSDSAQAPEPTIAAADRGRFVAPTGVELGRVAWAGKDQAWGVEASTGALVHYDGLGRVQAADQRSVDETLSRALRALAGIGLAANADSAAGAGLRSLDFDAGGRGAAVGDDGRVLTYDDGHWTAVKSPTDGDLNDVAVRAGQALVGGADGTLSERDGDGWSRSAAAADLIGDANVTAVDLLGDGTALAAAGGAILARPDGGDWRPAALQPLGIAVVKLRGYRTAEGDLRALALVRAGGATSLLDGGGDGWRPVGEQLGLAVSDFDLDARSGELLVAGRSVEGPVATRLRPGQGGTWTPAG